MRTKVIALSLLVLFSGISNAQTIQLVTEPFPPLNMTVTYSTFGKNEKVTGFATEIVREMFNRANVDMELTLYSNWDRGYKKAVKKTNYGIYSAFRTPDREKDFKWVGPLFKEEWILLAPKDSGIKVANLQDMKKYRIGSYENDAISAFLENKGVNVEKAQNDVVNATKIKLNKIDAWATSSLSGPFIAKRHKLDDLVVVYTFNSSGLWLAMNKFTDDETINQLNASLKRMEQNGSIEKIINSYL
ncbi:substrate-binding periplasmic protein [Zooshikella sp. RANM57]|uniref:substrate-binding periplasmic protein n=1 Tax=Zooshikella sp. RANM57 TaxID=3425863 RepID=UPI003D6FF05F